MTESSDPSGPHDPTELREQVEEEIHELTEEASDEEVERMAERDRVGVDRPSDEVNQNAS